MRLHNGGVRTHARESVLKVDSWRKIPCRTGESNLRRWRAGPILYQLSYIPTLIFSFFFFFGGGWWVFSTNNTDSSKTSVLNQPNTGTILVHVMTLWHPIKSNAESPAVPINTSVRLQGLLLWALSSTSIGYIDKRFRFGHHVPCGTLLTSIS